MKKILLIFFIIFVYQPLSSSQNFSFCKETDVVRDNCHGSTEYKEDGYTVTYVGNFKDNKPHGKGIHTYYFATGKDYPYKVITYEGTTHFGVFNGKFKITYQDKYYDISHFKLNNLHGKSSSYDKAGRLYAEQTFENGIKRSEIKFLNGPFVLRTESIFDSKEKLIETIHYYRDGRILTSKDGHKFEISNLAKPEKEPIRQILQPKQNVSEGNSINNTLKKILNK